MSVRMVPVGTVFSRFPRLVHDLAVTLGKKISLELVGEDIELDKGMVEQLADPLTHLVRNAVDHGIEMPEDRVAAGKSETGIVRLSALHTGGSVVIEVSDDGRGLQTSRIREKAIANGLIRDEDGMSEEEMHQLVFLPGFSTAGSVTSVSGRGVGMDVVKRNVEAMNGTVVVASRAGAGSSMRIRLPLTMAVMDGLALRVGAQLFLLPLIAIRESFRPKAAQVKTVLGRGEVVLVRDQSIPLVRLHEVFGIEDAERDPAHALVCIVDTGSARVALMVDEPLGQSQVVVKSLESNYRKIEGIMGATIMGDGKVALILDATAISRQAARAGLTREARHGTDACAA
jgi:two-component system chemotaxis sensor kinase CheA